MPLPSSSRPILQVRNLHKNYSEGSHSRSILQGVDLDVAAGETVVLLGRSGSGKSTLLNMLGGMDMPSSGSIQLDSRDFSQLSEKERTLVRRQKIGFVFQFFNLIPTLTVLENVMLPLELLKVPAQEATLRALELLAEVGLSERVNTYPDRLSGGEQQRVAIARALVHEPAIVLADEPTGNLDEKTAAGVIELFERLIRRRGRTLVLVTHDRGLTRLADNSYEMQNGMLVHLPAVPAQVMPEVSR